MLQRPTFIYTQAGRGPYDTPVIRADCKRVLPTRGHHEHVSKKKRGKKNHGQQWLESFYLLYSSLMDHKLISYRVRIIASEWKAEWQEWLQQEH